MLLYTNVCLHLMYLFFLFISKFDVRILHFFSTAESLYDVE